MAAPIEAIALSAPIMAANLVFAPRRIGKGTVAMDKDPVYGVLNYDIAAGQTLKSINAAEAIIKQTESSADKEIVKASAEAAKGAGTGAKIAKGAMSVVNFTADHINPIICVTSGIRVINSNNKADTLVDEGCSLGGMFAAEKTCKNFVGMPYLERNKKTKKMELKSRPAKYHNYLFIEKQVNALKDVCATKKALKALPPTLKGVALVTSSILGYSGGHWSKEHLIGTVAA